MRNNVMIKIAKLSKESNLELKSEKVELGMVDDFESRIEKAIDGRKGASVLQSKLLGAVNKAVINLELAIKESVKIEKAANDLGVKSPVNSTKAKADLKELQKAASTIKGLSI